MKNLYPIFLFVLILNSFHTRARAADVFTQAETLLILDRNYLYENDPDTLLSYIQELSQRHGSSVRIFEKEKDFSKNLDYSRFQLIVAVGEKSLLSLSPEVREKLKAYILGLDSGGNSAFLGIFFQEDRKVPSETWSWFQGLKEELAQQGTKGDNFSIPLRVSSPAIQTQSQPLAYQRIFPSLLPEKNPQGNRVFLSYMAARQGAFSHKSQGKLRNTLLQTHLEDAWAWVHGKEQGLLEKAEILSLSLASYGNKVLFRWDDRLEADDSKYFLQQSTDGLNWENIHTRSSLKPDSGRAVYGYLFSEIQKGDHVFRVLKKEQGKADVYSLPALLSVSAEIPVVELFPNPATDMLYIKVSGEKDLETSISIRSAVLGQPVWQTTLQPGASELRVPVLISFLRPGLYHVCVKTHEARIWSTFLKYD